MTANKLVGIDWYVDSQARGRGEPGIYHSFMASLATVINHTAGEFDPAWLMGVSGFAFRSFVNEQFCPSAMSIFDWSALPEAVEQSGYRCIYVDRLWDEGEREAERRAEAHTAIISAIDRGVAAVVWDLAGCEWGVVVGYDESTSSYDILTSEGGPSSLAFERLGRNGIDILSVAIPGVPNDRSREEVLHNSLKVAVAHAKGEEWTDRPRYQNGLAGLDLWATLYDRWALIVDAGKAKNLPSQLLELVVNYAGHHYSARCYARDYLAALAREHVALAGPSECFQRVASHLRPLWHHARGGSVSDGDTLRDLAESVREARAVEAEAVAGIEDYLARPTA